MRLGDFLTVETKINKEILIGKEIEILEGETLLLAIQEGEFFVEEEGGVGPATRLLALYDAPEEEEPEEDEDWESEDEWDDEGFEEKDYATNRQAIISEKEEFEPELLDVSEIIVNGRSYTVYEAEESWMEERPHDAVETLKRADEAGILPEEWADKDLESLSIVEYIVDDSMMNIAWDADILAVGVEFSDEDDSGEILCGKLLTCPCGRMDVPRSFEIKAPSGKIVTVKVYGVHVLDVWKDAPVIGLDEDELEDICSPDQRLLAVEYSADEDVLLNFYTRDYLDEEARLGDELPELILGMEDHELRLIDVVPADFDEDVELELLSYEVFED